MRALVFLGLAACANVYVDPIALEAKTEAPAVMLLLDASGSMLDPVSCSATPCPRRIDAVRSWAGDMLGELGSSARWGLTVYPSDNLCGVPGLEQVVTPIPEAPGAGDLVAKLQAVAPRGGTPTGASLNFAAQTFPSGTAERIVVLLTDGNPNCNPQNAVTCADAAACRCTLMPAGACMGMFCATGCLDEAATVSTLGALSTFGVSAVVIGFGGDFADPTTVNAMAQAGLSGSRCAEDSDCFGYVCTGGRCTGGALLARDEAMLGVVTEALRQRLELSSRCRWTLLTEQTGGPGRIELDGTRVPAEQYVVESTTRVRFLGEACRKLRADATLAPKFSAAP